MRRPQVDTSATSRLPHIKMLFYRIQNCGKYQAKPSMGLIDLDNGLRRLSIMGLDSVYPDSFYFSYILIQLFCRRIP